MLRHIAGSSAGFTDAQLADTYVAPDWRPRSHAAMPLAVALGRAPDTFACGYCHTPGGQGRPENASLAGLPAAYIVQQVVDIQNGERRSALPGPYRPTDAMLQTAQHVTQKELTAAAIYFSREALGPRVRVVEAERVPKPRVVGYVYAAQPDGEEEPLGERLLEYSPDPVRHELRDDQMVYVAYVPPGSLARGEQLVRQGVAGLPTACATCHGSTLRGVGLVPPIAGRSPSYLLRQLIALKTGARHGAAAAPMQPVVAALDLGKMIDAVSYAASLRP
jgi:cytochrome c553